MDKPPEQNREQSQSGELAKPLRVVAVSELMGNDDEIVIDHGGVRYKLRVTRRGRLILTK